VRSPRLVGREAETGQLTTALAGLGLALVLVEGEAVLARVADGKYLLWLDPSADDPPQMIAAQDGSPGQDRALQALAGVANRPGRCRYPALADTRHLSSGRGDMDPSVRLHM
jgi:hypothetical protein